MESITTERDMSLDYESAKLIASCTEGKLTADDVINLATYGTTNAQDMNPFQGELDLENTCMCGEEIDKCPEAYSHMTQGY